MMICKPDDQDGARPRSFQQVVLIQSTKTIDRTIDYLAGVNPNSHHGIKDGSWVQKKKAGPRRPGKLNREASRLGDVGPPICGRPSRGPSGGRPDLESSGDHWISGCCGAASIVNNIVIQPRLRSLIRTVVACGARMAATILQQLPEPRRRLTCCAAACGGA